MKNKGSGQYSIAKGNIKYNLEGVLFRVYTFYRLLKESLYRGFCLPGEQFLFLMTKMAIPFAGSFQLTFQWSVAVRTAYNISGPLTLMDFNFIGLVTSIKVAQ